MALKDIIDKIMDDAKAEAAAIAEAGEQDYNATLERKNQEIVAALAELKARHLAQVRSSEEQAEFRARLLKKNTSLRSKQALLEEVFSAIKKRLLTLSDQDYLRLFIKMLKDAPQVAGAEIIVAAKRAAVAKKALAATGLSYRIANEYLPAGVDVEIK